MTEPAPCPSCHASIPGVVAAAPFCPFCGANKFQAQAHAPVPVPAAKAANDRPKKPEHAFSSWLGGAALAFDPRAGYAILRSHQPDGEPARLRVWDLHQKRVAWEALSGQLKDDDLDYESLRVHGGNVYVGVDRTLRVLDLFTGRPKWGAELSDKLAYDATPFASRGVRVVDPAPAGTRGTAWAVTVDNVVFALDRDTGQLLWREEREHMPSQILPFESGLLLLRHRGGGLELLEPARKTVIDKVVGQIERLDVEGHLVLAQVENWGWRERDGLLLHDLLAKKEIFFEPIEHLEDDVPGVLGHGRAFCAAEDGAKIVAAPQLRAVEPMPGFRVRALTMCGPTLMALLVKHQGTSLRRVVGLDPQTLAIRFDLGDLSTEPNEDYATQISTNGLVTVLVTSPKDDRDACELWGVDPRGNVLWRHPVGEWSAHWFLGGNVVVSSSQGWQILRPDTGQVLGSCSE